MEKRTLNLRRGSILTICLVGMFMVSVLTVAMLSLSVQALRHSNRSQNNTIAMGLAESGVDRALRYMKDLGYPPSGQRTINPFGGKQLLGKGSYRVSIVPDAGNTQAMLKKYKIVSDGTSLDRSVRVELTIRQSSFGKYAYFTDREVSSFSGGRIWFFNGDRIRGPAHSNNAASTAFQVSWQGAEDAIFQDVVTTVAKEVNYSPTSPKGEDEFSQVYSRGTKALQTGVDYIPLPKSSDMQKIAAWGSESGFPTNDGVYTPSRGGIYIKGNSAVKMKLDGMGNQQFVITQGQNVSVVTVDLGRNVTTLQVNNAAPTITSGTGTGVVYCTGNITSLSGTLANNLVAGSPARVLKRSAYTIATDVDTNKGIVVTDSIVQSTKFDPKLPLNSETNMKAGTLGLVAKDVKVVKGAPRNLEIDGIIFAGNAATQNGSFYVEDYSSKKPTGTLRVMGGILQQARGPVGTFSQRSGIVTGYAKDYWYDARLADDPPPFFPTTGGYDRISWQRDNQV